MYLKRLVYYFKYLRRTSRILLNNGSTVPRINTVYEFEHVEEAYSKASDGPAPIKLAKMAQIQEKIEEVEQYLNVHRGASGVYLTYMIREDTDPLNGEQAT